MTAEGTAERAQYHLASAVPRILSESEDLGTSAVYRSAEVDTFIRSVEGH